MKAQKVWILEDTKTGKLIKVGVRVASGTERVHATSFETKKGLLAALGFNGPKDLESGEKIKRIELNL